MHDEENKFKLGPIGCGALASLFSTITNGEIRAAFKAGEYFQCLEYALMMTVVTYILFAVGYVVLSMWLGNAAWFKKAEKFRKPILIICALLIYAATLYVTILIFD